MDQMISTRDNEVAPSDATLSPLWQETSISFGTFEDERMRGSEQAGPASSLDERLVDTTFNYAWRDAASRVGQDELAHVSRMKMTDFIETRFMPYFVSLKNQSARIHYQAMLRHIITPEEVDRIFQVVAVLPDQRLKRCPDWPYLSNLRLCDARPSHVQRLVSVALARGYSTQTVAHIRNTVNAIFSYAKQEGYLTSDNPARSVMSPDIVRKKPQSLTLSQVNDTLRAMMYPEREMAMVALLTPMTMAEICAMQWKYLNLSNFLSNADGEPCLPKTIAVRKHLVHGEFGDVPKSRKRNLPICDVLFDVLLGLQRRAKFTGPDDFVFVSGTGSPFKHIKIKERRLKPIGKQFQMPWLSWQTFRHTRTTLLCRFGTTFYDHMVRLALAESSISEPGESSVCQN